MLIKSSKIATEVTTYHIARGNTDNNNTKIRGKERRNQKRKCQT